jgi:hypothetical protein
MVEGADGLYHGPTHKEAHVMIAERKLCSEMDSEPDLAPFELRAGKPSAPGPQSARIGIDCDAINA